jgi:hypothetical protein
MRTLITLLTVLPFLTFAQHILFLGGKAHIGNGESIDV